jgi:hypothetical protein
MACTFIWSKSSTFRLNRHLLAPCDGYRPLGEDVRPYAARSRCAAPGALVGTRQRTLRTRMYSTALPSRDGSPPELTNCSSWSRSVPWRRGCSSGSVHEPRRTHPLGSREHTRLEAAELCLQPADEASHGRCLGPRLSRHGCPRKYFGGMDSALPNRLSSTSSTTSRITRR